MDEAVAMVFVAVGSAVGAVIAYANWRSYKARQRHWDQLIADIQQDIAGAQASIRLARGQCMKAIDELHAIVNRVSLPPIAPIKPTPEQVAKVTLADRPTDETMALALAEPDIAIRRHLVQWVRAQRMNEVPEQDILHNLQHWPESPDDVEEAKGE